MAGISRRAGGGLGPGAAQTASSSGARRLDARFFAPATPAGTRGANPLQTLDRPGSCGSPWQADEGLQEFACTPQFLRLADVIGKQGMLHEQTAACAKRGGFGCKARKASSRRGKRVQQHVGPVWPHPRGSEQC